MKGSRGLSSDFAAWCLGIGLIFLTYSVPFHQFAYSIEDDDYQAGAQACHLQWVTRFSLLPFPDGACDSRSIDLGAGLVWAPAGWLAKGVALLTSRDVDGWLLPCLGLFQYFLVFGALTWLLLRVWRLLRERSPAGKLPEGGFWPWLILFCTPVVYYTTRMPLLPHVNELLWSLLLVYGILLHRPGTAVLATFLLCLTRINDFPAVLLLAGAWLDRRREGSVMPAFWASFPRSVRVAGAIAVGVGVAIMGGHVLHRAFVEGYNMVRVPQLLEAISLERVIHVFVGVDWGLLWLAPFWVGAFVGGWVFLWRLSWVSRAGLVWMVLELVVVCGWRGQGNSFGYRYLAGTYAAALLIWVECLTLARGVGWLRGFKFSVVLGGLFLAYLMWVFGSLPELELEPASTRGGILTQPRLVLNALMFLPYPVGHLNMLGHTALPTLIRSLYRPGEYFLFAQMSLEEETLWGLMAGVGFAAVLCGVGVWGLLRWRKEPASAPIGSGGGPKNQAA